MATFKKITKRDNKVMEAFKDDPKPESLQPKELDEPVIRKQQKTTSQFFSTRDTTEEYGKLAGELNEDLKFRANTRLLGAHGEDATRANDVDTSRDADPRTKFLEKLEISKQIKEGKLDSKIYRGNDYYATYIDKSQEEISKSKFTGALGPIRAPTNIRTTSRVDVNPSLCKDWHVSGFCAFGDTCIYIHDRGDYKSGWEMERDWEAEEKKRRANGEVTDDEDDNLESDKVPRICSICEKPFKNPVVTRCGHIFCESCALAHNQTTPMCKECGKPTNGILNDATKVLAKMREEAEKVDLQKGNRQKLNEKKRRDEEDYRDDDGPEFDVFDGVVIEGEDGEKPLAAKKEMKAVEKKAEPQKVDALDDLEKLNYQFKKQQNKKKGFATSASDWLL